MVLGLRFLSSVLGGEGLARLLFTGRFKKRASKARAEECD